MPDAHRRRVIRRILVAFGPTAGHVYPALAFAAAYKAAFEDAEILFAAAADGTIDAVLAQERIATLRVTGAPLADRPWRARIGVVGSLSRGIIEARRLVAASGTRLAVGFGGYTSGEVLVAARAYGARTILHEANARFGLANWLSARVVDRVCVGWAGVDARRLEFTGTPIRPEIAALAGVSRDVSFVHRAARFLVTSGTGGSRFLATHVPPLLADVRAGGQDVEVLHQAERDVLCDARDAYEQLGVDAEVVPHLDMAVACRWADVVISRAGASTMAELAAAGLPAVLVPLASSAANHQAANAQRYHDEGAALMVSETDWARDRIAAHLINLLGDGREWQAAHEAVRRFCVPDAGARMVAVCEQLMAGLW